MLFSNVFQDFVERPIFNLLELIYALVPGHDLGISIILFTLVIRLALWPLLRKQLHHTKAMRKLQPELKRIKKDASGDRQKEARMQMELYKEHGVKPFSTIGTLLIQIPIFIALYQSVLKLINNPDTLQTFSYESIRDLAWIQHLAVYASDFEHTLFGIVDLSNKAFSSSGMYFPALVLAVLASAVQFYQSKMLLPDAKDSRKLSVILKEAGQGKQADQSEVATAVSRGMVYVIPFFTFIFAIFIPAALTLYLVTSAAVGYMQQKYILGKDQEEMQEVADAPLIKKSKKDKKAETVSADGITSTLVEAPKKKAKPAPKKPAKKKPAAKRKKKK